MKYLILIYSNMRNWGHPSFLHTPEADEMSEPERASMTAEFEALMEEISSSGELVSGVPLADPVNTRRVRVREGSPAVTDGPFPESKEQLAGYFVVQCESPDRAVEIAARFPDARFATVQVRPVMDESAQDI